MTASTTAQPESVLRLSRITKRFGALIANDAISLDVKEGEIVGLLGENGAGKTTLMSILFGHYLADEGEITVRGEALPPGSPHAAIAAGIGMVHQHFTLADNLPVLDNIILGAEPLWQLTSARGAARARVHRLAQDFGLEVDPDAVVAGLTVGERQRVEILKALYREARILILDEPTAVLTPQESASLFATLKRFVAHGLSVIFISHKLSEILAACERVYVLRSGTLVAERAVAGTSRAELAELMVGRPLPQPKVEPRAAGEVVLELHDISANRGAHWLRNVGLELRAGEILGVAGVSGNGQTLLADVISGTLLPATGTVVVAGAAIAQPTPRRMVTMGVGRIPEDRHSEGLIGDMSITENVMAETYDAPPFSRRGLIDWRAARAAAEQAVAAYQVKCQGLDGPVRLLSGGNMQKLILGRVMARSPRVVLANQPTRGLDVGAVAYVHEQLLAARARGAGILLISEDLEEMLSLADRIAVIHRGHLSAPLARAGLSIGELGLMMAGHGSGGDVHAA